MGEVETIEFDLNEDTIILVYLSHVYSIDIEQLLLLYEKYDKDVFYFFYLFTKSKVEFPTASKLSNIILYSRNIHKYFKNSDNYIFKSKQEQEVFSYILKFYNNYSNKFCFRVNVGDGELGYVQEESEISSSGDREETD